MSSRVVAALRRALRARLPGSAVAPVPEPSRGRRSTVVHDDDTFLVSYPRSGNAWLRRLIAAVQDPTRDIDVAHIEQWVPDIYAVGPALEHYPRPRIMKSHERFDSAYPRVIYLVRDGRDVAVSYYNLSRTLGGFEGAFSDFLERFLSGAGLPFGSWASHVESWLDGLDPKRLLIRYEDLHRDPAVVLGRVTEHLGWRLPHERILQAIEVCRFERHHDDLRRIERLTVRGYERGLRGGPGGWRNAFNPNDLTTFWARAGSTMRKLGYQDDDPRQSGAGAGS